SFFKTYNRRHHRKLLVIDDRVAYFGGMNIVDHASETATDSPKRSHTAIGWRDVHVRLEGTQQRFVAESFELSWQRAQGQRSQGQASRSSATHLPLGLLLARDRQTSLPPPAECLASSTLATNNAAAENNDEWIRFFDSGPGPRSQRAARVFTRLLQAARFRLTFSMAYFLPVGQVRRALFQSAQRGVRVRVVLPSFSDMPFIQRATRYFYDVLLRRRFEVFERQQRMLHSKVLIMDDEYVVLGSSNFDVRSLWINWEFVVLIRSRHLAALMTEVVNREARQSVRVTKSFWRNQSWWQRLLDRIAWSLRLWL
ncbi:MAG TPA: phospholipase D-like domain-containing protein, partial [Planctomycetaceae bacterium]|nr:phospholipase D-like domain-containing protein [Planctomycetaceae bacterium]